jgi:DNA polymerase-3 subunit delta
MALVTFEKLLQSLKEKKFQPVYFFHGPESYYIDYLTDYIEQNVLSESEKGFNLQIFYGKDIDTVAIRNAASRYPLMSPYQVIIVKEAQNLKDLAGLESYFEKPIPTTVLVFAHKYKTIDKRLRVTKTLEKNALLFESKKIDEKKLSEWIQQYVKENKYSITPKATALLAEYIGAELEVLVNTLDKIMLALPEGSGITEKEVETHAGISREYNVFELTKALGTKDKNKLARLMNYFTTHTKENPFPVIIGALYSYFSKIAAIEWGRKTDKETLGSYGISGWGAEEYLNGAKTYKGKTAGALKIIEDFDLRFKGVNGSSIDESELLREMVYRLAYL